MLADVIDLLRCPLCHDPLDLAERAVRCARGHSFDVARQGYVNLLTGSSPPGTADTPAMVAARDSFLSAGHYAPLAARIAELSQSAAVIGDAGAGSGYYLATAIAPMSRGLALDISKHALKRAARAHPRIGAATADIWKPLPLRNGALDCLLNVFAPRNPAEFHRVLTPDGTLTVVTPAPGHLAPLVDQLGLLKVDGDKERKLGAVLGGHFDPAHREEIAFEMALDHAAVRAVVEMGPSAWHADSYKLVQDITTLPNPVMVRASLLVTAWTRKRSV